jgi:hypothetical protein
MIIACTPSLDGLFAMVNIGAFGFGRNAAADGLAAIQLNRREFLCKEFRCNLV